MIAFPLKNVHATTREELDAALASPLTKSIVVEGDDELLSYAARKASSEPDLSIGGVSLGAEAAVAEHGSTDPAPPASAPPRPAPAGRPAPALPPAPDRSATRGAFWAALGTVAVVLGVGLFWFTTGLQQAPPTTSAPGTTPAPEPSAAPPALAKADLSSLVWAVVAIVAIVALYLIARQAISSGSNVEIHWQVTEKVTGRLVITKQSRPAAAKRAA